MAALDQMNPSNDWIPIQPQVHAEAEFFEILNDFGNPLELLREGISNAIDAHATQIEITFEVKPIDGANRLVITLFDDGHGMTEDILKRDFWGLGYSPSRERSDSIGEKGHGTKIYLRSERVEVETQNESAAYFSLCEHPLRSLARKELHQPFIKRIDRLFDHTGTRIKVIGYNDNERSRFVQNIVKDYLLWFTKIGSIEHIFGNSPLDNFQVHLKCLDRDEHETIPFGHLFPLESPNIEKLFEEKGVSAADWYVKRYVWKDRLIKHPEVTYQAVISVEGDEAKRLYNPMLRKRRRSETGTYRVRDRYGLWLCKDYIPIVNVNEWLPAIGTGTGSYVLLHGFVNCQSLKLTANRGDIANTDPNILDELQTVIENLVLEVDTELRNQGVYTVRNWLQEETTLQQEKEEFTRRTKVIKSRWMAELEGQILLEPRNESELFGLFVAIYTLHPELFDFEPLDYNTTRGIDIIARNRGKDRLSDEDYCYVELKYALQKRFNHAFQYLRWVLCWDFDKGIELGSDFRGIEETDVRLLETAMDDNGRTLYFLDNKKKSGKIQVIRLKEYLKQRLNLEFGRRP